MIFGVSRQPENSSDQLSSFQALMLSHRPAASVPVTSPVSALP